jgi:UDP-glucose 4-epimerase
MRVLVTGGAGFIGSHLAERLVGLGHDVFVVDSEATGHREHVPAGAKYKKGDVCRVEEMEEIFRAGLDAVAHIAGQVSLIRSFTDPVVDLRTNVEGTVNVLGCCIRHRVPRLLYASSMTVYGHNGVLPTAEHTPSAPVSYYGITKYAAERYVHTTAARPDLDFHFGVTSFRMYNVYGPGQALDNPYQGVLGIFLGNLLRGEPLTIFGDGSQSRDFIYIDDVIDAWVAALTNEASHGQVLNLGSGQRLKISDLADQVLAASGLNRDDWPVAYAPGRPGEQLHVEADVARAGAVLGWKPQIAFPEGLARTVQWARDVTAASPYPTPVA